MERMIELQALHDALDERLGALERFAVASRPNLCALNEARLQLTRASRRRVEYLQTSVIPYLLSTEASAHQHVIEQLREAMVAGRAASTDHISRWPPSEIEKNWNGYQRASQAIRAMMRAHLQREKVLLYPLLRVGTAEILPMPQSKDLPGPTGALDA